MSAVELILEIEKLPQGQRRKVFAYVGKQLRREEDRRDNEASNRALEEPWRECSMGRGPQTAGLDVRLYLFINTFLSPLFFPRR
jgi:hypothetical protein